MQPWTIDNRSEKAGMYIVTSQCKQVSKQQFYFQAMCMHKMAPGSSLQISSFYYIVVNCPEPVAPMGMGSLKVKFNNNKKYLSK